MLQFVFCYPMICNAKQVGKRCSKNETGFRKGQGRPGCHCLELPRSAAIEPGRLLIRLWPANLRVSEHAEEQHLPVMKALRGLREGRGLRSPLAGVMDSNLV